MIRSFLVILMGIVVGLQITACGKSSSKGRKSRGGDGVVDPRKTTGATLVRGSKNGDGYDVTLTVTADNKALVHRGQILRDKETRLKTDNDSYYADIRSYEGVAYVLAIQYARERSQGDLYLFQLAGNGNTYSRVISGVDINVSQARQNVQDILKKIMDEKDTTKYSSALAEMINYFRKNSNNSFDRFVKDFNEGKVIEDAESGVGPDGKPVVKVPEGSPPATGSATNTGTTPDTTGVIMVPVGQGGTQTSPGIVPGGTGVGTDMIIVPHGNQGATGTAPGVAVAGQGDGYVYVGRQVEERCHKVTDIVKDIEKVEEDWHKDWARCKSSEKWMTRGRIAVNTGEGDRFQGSGSETFECNQDMLKAGFDQCKENNNHDDVRECKVIERIASEDQDVNEQMVCKPVVINPGELVYVGQQGQNNPTNDGGYNREGKFEGQSVQVICRERGGNWLTYKGDKRSTYKTKGCTQVNSGQKENYLYMDLKHSTDWGMWVNSSQFWDDGKLRFDIDPLATEEDEILFDDGVTVVSEEETLQTDTTEFIMTKAGNHTSVRFRIEVDNPDEDEYDVVSMRCEVRVFEGACSGDSDDD